MKNRFVTLVTAMLMLTSVVTLSAQSFRGNVVRFVVVGPRATQAVELGVGEVIILSFDPAQPFVHGVEIELVADHSLDGSFAIAVYDSVEPPDSTGFVDLNGRQRFLHPLADGRRQIVVLPTADTTTPVRAGVAIAPRLSRQVGSSLAVQIVPLLKGGIPTTAGLRFATQLRPIPAPIGGVLVGVQGPGDSAAPPDLRVTINGTSAPVDEIVELQPGIHRLVVEGSGIVPVSRNVGVEAGILTELNIRLERPMARVRLSLPNVAEAFINGQRIRDAELTIEPGEHALLIRLVDYTVTRRLQLEGQRAYEIGLELDIFVKAD